MEREFGNAILSRWPIDASTTHDLPCDDVFPKVVLHARTAGVDVFCVHLTADPAAAQVRAATGAPAIRGTTAIHSHRPPT